MKDNKIHKLYSEGKVNVKGSFCCFCKEKEGEEYGRDEEKEWRIIIIIHEPYSEEKVGLKGPSFHLPSKENIFY